MTKGYNMSKTQDERPLRMDFGKRLYTVQIVTEVIVIAESCVHAEREAAKIDLGDLHLSFRGASMSAFPAQWNGDDIPYGQEDPNDPDRTVDEWIERGAAPLITAFRQRMREDREG